MKLLQPFNKQSAAGQKILWVAVRLFPGLLLGALVYYFALPPLNVHAAGFWGYLLFLCLAFTLPFGLYRLVSVKVNVDKKGQRGGFDVKVSREKLPLILLGVTVVPLVVLLVGGISSSTFFNARRYAGIIEVTDADFATDMPETENVTNIALMDSASAAIIGNRALGSLSEVVSQFELTEEYTQINFQGAPQKVANLEYAGFFKWLGNHKNGVPGYVMVDPVNNTATYQKLDEGMRYTESAYFGEDLMRRLRFDYPTKIFGNTSFELDEEGNPYFVISCMKPKVGLFGAQDVSEIILFNPVDGTSSVCPVEETPRWVDIAYNGYLAEQKYNWHGTLAGGFWNSIIGNKGCRKTTDDFGYLMYDDDVWYYTGVTSVNQDASNIGFIVSNARTGEYKFYSVVGAEEYSAMGAAEGEVQEKGYRASFPALVNISGEATYLMVLKDASGLVKLYALVNVEKYSVVATGATQAEAMDQYRQLLVKEGVLEPEAPPVLPTLTATVTVNAVRDVVVDGNTRIYFYASDGQVYRADAAGEAALLIAAGDVVTFTYAETGTAGIRAVQSFEKAAD